MKVWIAMEQAKRSAALSLKWKMLRTYHAAVDWSSEYFKMRRVARAQSWTKSSDRHAICGLCNVHLDALASILLMIVRRHWVHRNPFHRFNKLIDQFGAFYRNSRKCRLISFVSAARTGPFSVLRFAYVNFKLIIRIIGLGFGLGLA